MSRSSRKNRRRPQVMQLVRGAKAAVDAWVRHVVRDAPEVELPRVVQVLPRVVKLPAIPLDPVLVDMHTYMRPMDSEAEDEFIKKYVNGIQIPGGNEHRAWYDEAGNQYYIVGDGLSPMMWSAHTDTVQTVQGRQHVEVSEEGVLTTTDGSCLGADDAAGVYVLRRMIEAGVPGLYVFHRGEERGCIGSKWINKHFWQLFAAAQLAGGGVKAAVAFDRKDVDEVITHQGGVRCCSDAFAESLAGVIGMDHKPSERGVYTDTKEYVDLIGECTNVGVGYQWAHGPKEQLDGAYLMLLAEAMCKFDESKMVFERKAGDRQEPRGRRVHGGYGGGDAGLGYRLNRVCFQMLIHGLGERCVILEG